MAYKSGDRVTLTSDVRVIAPYTLTLRKGETGTVVGAMSAAGMYTVHFDTFGITVVIGNAQMVHAVDQLALLRAQLAARDAALDAVLEQLANMRAAESDDARVCGMVLTDLLLKHGVHPK